MFQLSKSILWCVLCLASLVGLTVRLVGPVVVIAADLERQVASPIVPKNTPVVVAKITLDDKVVQTGRFAKPATELPDPITPFEAEDDWVQNTTVYLLNRTNRNLTYLYIVFGFPETLVGREERAFPLLLGVVPQSAFFDKVVNPSGRPIVNPTRAKPLLVRPGEILAIHLGDYIAQIQDRVGAYIPLKRLRQMNVTLQM